MSSTPSLFNGTATITCNSTITNSSITNSTIDMNGAEITSVGDPVNTQDAATKAYVDTRTSTLLNINVTLTGTVYSTVTTNILSGVLTVMINSSIANSPVAHFVVGKKSNGDWSWNRTLSIPGTTTDEYLIIDWSGTYLQLRKSGTNYDGTYTVNIIS